MSVEGLMSINRADAQNHSRKVAGNIAWLVSELSQMLYF